MGNFPGLKTILGGDHKHRQDAVFASHGGHPLVEFHQDRYAVKRRGESGFLVGFRALSRDGRCATDMGRVAQRHRGKPGREPEQTLRYGISIRDPEKYACRGQREQGWVITNFHAARISVLSCLSFLDNSGVLQRVSCIITDFRGLTLWGGEAHHYAT